MARRESAAIAGFFATPPQYLPTIADILRPERQGRTELTLVDPCAGEGAALVALRDGLLPGVEHIVTLACEMEAGRHAKLREHDPLKNHWNDQRAHLLGDFFHVRWEAGVADICYLNPPYDQDRQFKRLEARFLHHAAPMLTSGGVLVFVVPHYCLAACAGTFAKHFADLQAFRFAGADFEVYKQVILFARKATRSAPDLAVADLCRKWSEDAGSIPEFIISAPDHLPFTRYIAHPRQRRYQLPTWEMTHFDVAAVATLDPWESERGAIPDLSAPLDLSTRIGAVYPIVSPPRPVHLAAALAAGVFNGLHVQADTAALPDLLVKGTFKRKWDTVDQRHNEDGELTSETQIERPELEVWVLDLSTGTYHALASSPVVTDDLPGIAGATFADLLTRYSRSLLLALRAACPVLHDPGRGDPEPPVDLGRPLWRAQNSTLHAANKLANLGRGVLIVGEVGTGKTGITAALLRLRGIRRALVQVPPHLLSSWRSQIATVLPGVDVVELRAISDVKALATHPGPVVAILSREASKLGHGWRGVAGGDKITCPKCGATVPDAGRLSERRATCEALTVAPPSRGGAAILGRWLLANLYLLLRYLPSHTGLVSLLPPTPAAERFMAWTKKAKRPEHLRTRVSEAVATLITALAHSPKTRAAIVHQLCWALPELAPHALSVLPRWQPGTEDRHLLQTRQAVALALPLETAFELEDHPDEHNSYNPKGRVEAWSDWTKIRSYVHGQYAGRVEYYNGQPHHLDQPSMGNFGTYRDALGYSKLALHGHARGSIAALDAALHTAVTLAHIVPRHRRPWTRPTPEPTAICGEPLYQAEPSPRRYPLGTYISRYASDLVDAVIFDECHELAAETSAQGIVSTRLSQMANKRKALLVYLTGSIANGYVDSIFHALRAVSPAFRSQFGHGQREQFVDRYGLRKRVVIHETSKSRSSRGAHSERITSGIKKAGMAPGVLPTLLLDHLLGSAAIIHKADLDLDLPPATEERITLPLTAEQEAILTEMLATVKQAIKETRFKRGCAGKLFGAFTKLLSYPDLAACGDYEVRWPESVEPTRTANFDVYPGALVTSAPSLPRDLLLPKEAWMLAEVQEEIANGRGSMVLPAHIALLDRYAWIFEQAGIEAAVLRSDKVPPAKREAWIEAQLAGKKRRKVLVVNPTAVQTGLNNLVYLQSALWMENPECKPIVYRQANGRLHRPGQEKPVRLLLPCYQHALPEAGLKLLLHKVGVSLAVDGLDPEAVYAAAGIGDETTAGLSVGHELYRMLVGAAE